MQYKQKFFRKIPESFSQLTGKYLIGKNLDDFTEAKLIEISSRASWEDGQAFLPSKIGKTSKINADGKIVKRKDLPKVTDSQELNYKRSELHGRDRVEVEGSTWRYYQRYVREELPAPNVSIKCIVSNDEKFFVIECDSADDDDLLLHKLNLALELFESEFELHVSAKDGFVKIPSKFKFVHWEILPSGEKTQEEVITLIKSTISSDLKKTMKPVVEKRLSMIANYEPDNIAIGVGGYKGYIVYNFPEKGISVLECDNVNNATYVFDIDNWEELSKLSKTEIIESNLARQRIIHDPSWKSAISDLLSA
ncbi:hypothetical protein [Psychrobacter immobilis]|uniref:hypothetical protein n=1 Tax=Psychrobacter immobilis TaxID=498 RepID=UPI001918AE50|nr:hypothetical protein [Psychrobacter immobilis]